MRVLGIDYGDRHIGLALTDALKLTAQPFGTYDLKASESENRKYFQDLVARYDVDEIVIGFPLRMDGTQGTRTRITKEFAGWLEKAVHKPIIFWDERLTTQQALHTIEDLKVRGKKKKECEDQISAVIILSTYLERKRGDSDAPQGR
jgi:putative Holliday junction resolvase